jgi:MoxR-like ATPase
MSNQDTTDLASQFGAKVNQLKSEVGKVIVGQDNVITALVNAIFCHGHVLMVGVPGLAKTLLVKTLSQAMSLDFNRIQFTPDLMPSDIIGSEILDENRQFKFIKGPVFANLLLADEINRTPPKTQSALLEAMQERQVTAGGSIYQLTEPFFVLATQNPIEQEGTYPLPEAQLDRFMYQVVLDYPNFNDEVQILKQTTSGSYEKASAVLSAKEIIDFQNIVRQVPVTNNVFEYVVALVQKTRPNTPGAHPMANKYLSYGAGPRAGQNLILGAKCNALMNGKFSVDIEDVHAVMNWVLSHRIVRNFKAEAEGISNAQILSNFI